MYYCTYVLNETFKYWLCELYGMDAELLFTGTKWNIIECLARKDASPIEIAKSLQTTVANVSMQLRMLDIGGVVTKRRLPNSKAGKPRTLYSLKKDILYIMVASSEFQFRKPFEMNGEKEIILRIWQLPLAVQGPLLYFYTNYSDLFNDEYDVYFSDHGDFVIKLLICNGKKQLPPKIVTFTHDGQKYVVDVRFVSEKNLSRYSRLTTLHKGLKKEE